jgi:hypothetical protein
VCGGKLYTCKQLMSSSHMQLFNQVPLFLDITLTKTPPLGPHPMAHTELAGNRCKNELNLFCMQTDMAAVPPWHTVGNKLEQYTTQLKTERRCMPKESPTKVWVTLTLDPLPHMPREVKLSVAVEASLDLPPHLWILFLRAMVFLHFNIGKYHNADVSTVDCVCCHMLM